MRRLRRAAYGLAVAAWLPLIVEWATIADPAGRTLDQSGDLAIGPAYALFFPFLLAFTVLLAVPALVIAAGARIWRAAWIAGAALVALGITWACLAYFTSYVGP